MRKLYSKPVLVVLMFGIYLTYILIMGFASRYLYGIELITESGISVEQLLGYPLVFGTSAWVASFFSLFWALWVIAVFFSQVKTWDIGLRRFFRAIVTLLLVLPLDWVLTSVLVGWLVGMHYGWHGPRLFPVQIVELWLQMFLFLSMALFFSSIARSFGRALVYFIGYFVAEALLRQVLFSFGLSIGHYLPAKIATRLVTPPVIGHLPWWAYNEYLSNNPLPEAFNFILGFVYAIFFLFLSNRIMKNSKY